MPPGSIAPRLTVCNNLAVLTAKRKNRNRFMVLFAQIRGKSYGRRSRVKSNMGNTSARTWVTHYSLEI